MVKSWLSLGMSPCWAEVNQVMEIVRLPALTDNYIFLLHDPRTRTAIVVDPAEPGLVLQVLDHLQADLVAILNTHHHRDHVGANMALLAQFPQLKIYAGEHDRGRIPGQHFFLQGGDRLSLLGREVTVFFVPGHTRAHIAYYFEPLLVQSVGLWGWDVERAVLFPQGVDQVMETVSPLENLGWEVCVEGIPLQNSDIGNKGGSRAAQDSHPLFCKTLLMGDLFCGDTLFAGGCGRLFEGTPAQMVASLTQLAALPDQTRVWCAHEYTLGNLRFAMTVDGDNANLQARWQQAQLARQRGEATIPSLLGLEKRTNPFLRWQEPALQQAVGSQDPIQTFSRLRGRKDLF